MNIGRAQKRITLFVILPAVVLLFSLRFYAQFRHVDVYVRTVGLMPTNLASRLPMEHLRIDPIAALDRPYENATNKILPPEEIRRIRSAIAWSSAMPALIDSLSIQSPTHVLARRTTKGSMREYQLVKRGDRWVIESATRQQAFRYSPK